MLPRLREATSQFRRPAVTARRDSHTTDSPPEPLTKAMPSIAESATHSGGAHRAPTPRPSNRYRRRISPPVLLELQRIKPALAFGVQCTASRRKVTLSLPRR